MNETLRLLPVKVQRRSIFPNNFFSFDWVHRLSLVICPILRMNLANLQLLIIVYQNSITLILFCFWLIMNVNWGPLSLIAWHPHTFQRTVSYFFLLVNHLCQLILLRCLMTLDWDLSTILVNEHEILFHPSDCCIRDPSQWLLSDLKLWFSLQVLFRVLYHFDLGAICERGIEASMLSLISVTGVDGHLVRVWVMCSNFVYFLLQSRTARFDSRFIDLQVMAFLLDSLAHVFSEQNF